MKHSCLLLMFVVAYIHAIPKTFKWHDTVTLHHHKRSHHEDFGDDGAHDLTHANLVDHTFDKSTKLREFFFLLSSSFNFHLFI